ncbi:hypothetical protein FPHYL_10666 [Fusarium phyllophilum]|uniref:Nitroreductase domain-containing protein n=1 Tax=Fusarium phyllophilum TaxID=47803 RepID=A0A8H5MZ75_9HYPO|nr:hypothetical protein FPHYL_10666 [Fusarium phyllophilum]
MPSEQTFQRHEIQSARNAVGETILERHSTRAFCTGQEVPMSVIEDCFSIAQHAPSSTNIQPWKVTVASGEPLKRLSAALVTAFENKEELKIDAIPESYNHYRSELGHHVYGPNGYNIVRGDTEAMTKTLIDNFNFYNAPVVAVISIDKALNKGDVLSVGIYLQTLLLLLTEKGLGTQVSAAPTGYPDIIKRELGIDENLDILLLTSLKKLKMDNSCAIPHGKEVSSGQVNDDLPTAEALKIADGIEVLDGKGEKHTFKSIYSGAGLPRRVLVVFSCVSYTSFLAKNATPEKLQQINTEVVIIGHGDPRTVDMYRIDTGCEFPIYTDPSEELYKTLGMIRTWEEGPPNKYIPVSPFWNAWLSMKNAFWKLLEGYPVWNWGTTNQQGGEFLFVGEGDDKKVRWCHRMKNSRDHTDTDEILEVLGLNK